MTTDGQGTRRDLERRALSAFEFLTATMPSTPRVVREPDRSHIQFVMDRVFVEVELDWREGATFVLVGAPAGDEVPAGYYVDGEGRKIRWHLSALLDEGGRAEAAENLRLLTRASGPLAMRQQIEAFADALAPMVHELPGLIQDLRSA